MVSQPHVSSEQPWINLWHVNDIAFSLHLALNFLRNGITHPQDAPCKLNDSSLKSVANPEERLFHFSSTLRSHHF